MGVVEFVEVRLHRARQRAVGLAGPGRVDMDGEILTGRIAGKNQRLAGEQAGQLDGIAVRPVERSRDDALLLLEHQCQSEMFDG